ncbi:MAG: thymidine phosphorylase [Acidimicrobiia bacterium]
MSFSVVELIVVKRDGGELSSEAITWLIDEYTRGSVPDYQMSAMAMAILLNGMSPNELTAWTAAMLNSGDLMDFSDLAAAKVDKHSTGGVGDKVSLPLAPLVASCGVVVPMISGRGLAHTGGTLDKLESVSGFTTALDPETFQSILRHHGLVMAGQSETMAPADQKLYALRDATGTVPSIPLIASSILSKKLAEGLDGLVLDVKTGSGASMRRLEDSRELARTMVEIASGYGVKTTALVTSMEQPLGREVGNASEIRESIDVLRGEGPPDVTELTMVLAEEMLELAGLSGGRGLLEEKIASGAAFDKLVEVTAAHGGDTAMLRDPSRLPVAAHEGVVVAESGGYVQKCDALTVGTAATHLGAGRERKEDTVHPGVGITVTAKIGDQVRPGEPLALVRYDQESKWLAYRDLLATAWTIGPDEVPAPPLIIERIHGAVT